MKFFETIFMEEVHHFFSKLDRKTVKKILLNIEIAEQSKDPRLFKKVRDDIWEFRTRFAGQQIRLLAFWDKNNEHTLVIATHGFTKKTNKVPDKEIEHAIKLKHKYNNS